MECFYCKNTYINEFKLNTAIEIKLIELIIKCNKCDKYTKYNIPIKNNILFKNNKGMHLKNYNYCGPYTNVIKNILFNVKPYNYIDKQCQLHDLSYHMFKDKEKRIISDKNLIHSMYNINGDYVTRCIIIVIMSMKLLFY
ncbi:hypothetical protein AHEVV2_007 [Adoxophyes honmai entomopoxvirus 'L' virophage 2]|nr:hypothetical protein AHEVV2_007 [Adoxophyes honmai entomopoxvirus 'L' virophage 2]